MNIPSSIPFGKTVLGVVAAGALLLPAFAQSRSEHERDRGVPPHVSPPPAPVHVAPRAPVPSRPVIVDRGNHGTIRHAEPRAVEEHHEAEVHHEVEVHHEADVHREVEADHRVFVHHDAEVDFGRRHFWHDFHYGEHVHALRPGHVQIVFGGLPYFYDDGIYYQQVGSDYQEIYPPVGIGIPQLPDGAVVIMAGNLTYYYAGGAFYVAQGDTYVIAAPPMGVIVPELPPGAATVSVGGVAAYQFNGIYYRPVFVDGVTQYQTFLP